MNITHLIMRCHRFLLPDYRRVGWVPYLWLVYLLGFIIPVGFNESLPWFLYCLTGSLIFLVLYFRAYWVMGRELWPYIAAMAAIGLATLPVHGSAMTFFIFAGSFAGFAGKPRTSVIILALLVCVQFTAMVLLAHHWIFLLVGNLFTALIGAVNIYYAELDRKSAQLKLSREETMQMARFAERERIARDLHDLLGHTLSVIALKADLAAKTLERDPKRAAAEIDDVRRISRDSLQQVREAVTGYRAHGLAAELANARLALEAIDVRFAYQAPPLELPSQVEAALALIVREAVTNTIRHARATRCWIDFRWESGELIVTISDNGIGGVEREGSGVRGMRDRLDTLQGDLSIRREKGRQLIVRIPLTTMPRFPMRDPNHCEPEESVAAITNPKEGLA